MQRPGRGDADDPSDAVADAHGLALAVGHADRLAFTIADSFAVAG